MRVAMALVKGDLAALKLLPRILRKRREIERIRKLSPSQVRKLLLRHRITLRELTRQAI